MPRRKRTHKFASFIAFLVLFIIAGIIGYLVYQSYFTEQLTQPNNEPSQNQEQTTTQIINQKTSTKDLPAPIEEDTKTPIKYDGGDPNQSNTITGVITYAGKTNNKLVIRVNIDQYLAAGSCNLVISQENTDIYGASANIISNASTATCEGFDVPADNFSGKYIITINLASDIKTGRITKEINL